MRSQICVLPALAVLACLVVPSAATAQGLTGSIDGTVNANAITRMHTLNRALANYLRPAQIVSPRAARIAGRVRV